MLPTGYSQKRSVRTALFSGFSGFRVFPIEHRFGAQFGEWVGRRSILDEQKPAFAGLGLVLRALSFGISFPNLAKGFSLRLFLQVHL